MTGRVRLDRMWLTDFRSYHTAELTPAADGLTVVVGKNGQGKTNLLEAIGWLATMSSFRGAPTDALVRKGAGQAVLRAEGSREERVLLVEAELPVVGRTRIQINRQPLRRARDLLGAFRVSVFSPDDLVLVKGGPGERRRLLDEALIAIAAKYDKLQSDVDRVLRQRGALLKQAGGRLNPEIEATLDVWDSKLSMAGAELARVRAELTAALSPAVAAAYDRLAAAPSHVSCQYMTTWGITCEDLAGALEKARADDLRRGVNTVGPHRDELGLTVNDMPARTHCSQGEQRTLALALRLAVHGEVGERTGSPPILLLDDVFSELDPTRTAALVANLPHGQALLTTAGDVPPGIYPQVTVRVEAGRLVTE